MINLRKKYGALDALKGVSLEVKAGEFIALLGPSGCGKTTLLSSIAGFVEVDEGTVEIDGRSLRPDTPSHERNLGVVFQHYALFPHMTVRRNVSFPLEIRRLPQREIDAEVNRSLAMVDLKKFQDRYPGELSGGQQQRVALARALIYSPPVLLLDEPLGALDRRLRDTMQAELKDLHQRLGKTFIYVTHDQDEALAMADRVVVMKGGQIEQQGSPYDLYESPATEFVAKFVGECNVVEGNWQVVGSNRQLVEPNSGAILHRSTRSEFAGDAQAKVAIRPEWFRVVASDTPGTGQSHQAIACRVLQSRFHGSETLFDVESPLGRLLIRVPHGFRHEVLLSSENFHISWDPDRTVLLHS